MMDRRRSGPGALVALAALCLAGACGDRFFTASGRVVECGTTTPVVGAKLEVRIDSQVPNTPRADGDPTETNADGKFTVELGDPPRAWVTLTFTKDGFTTLETQLKGEPTGSVDLCMTRAD